MKNQRLLAVAGIVGVIVVIALAFGARQVFFSGDGDAGESSGERKAAPLPAEWPKDFPVYPNATYLGADELQGQINARWFDRGWFETRDDPDQVIAWYDGQLTGAGYAPVTTLDTGYSKRYAFPAEKSVVEMEIYFDRSKPTAFSVDFFVTPTSAPR